LRAERREVGQAACSQYLIFPERSKKLIDEVRTHLRRCERVSHAIPSDRILCRRSNKTRSSPMTLILRASTRSKASLPTQDFRLYSTYANTSGRIALRSRGGEYRTRESICSASLMHCLKSIRGRPSTSMIRLLRVKVELREERRGSAGVAS
jgi:hypothetical protein